jgi:ABC-type antimicrobial peptide transport system permease subunit
MTKGSELVRQKNVFTLLIICLSVLSLTAVLNDGNYAANTVQGATSIRLEKTSRAFFFTNKPGTLLLSPEYLRIYLHTESKAETDKAPQVE